MKHTLVFLALIGLFAPGCDSANPALQDGATVSPTLASTNATRSPSSDQGWFTYTGTLYYSCVGEPIDTNIEAHYVWHSDTTPTGLYHYLDQWQAKMTGTGRYSGEVYRAQESTHYAAHWPDDGGDVFTFNWTSLLLQPESGMRYQVRTIAHLTQHPEGTVSVDVEHDDSTCRTLESALH